MRLLPQIALGLLSLVAIAAGGAGHLPAASADGPCDEALARALALVQEAEKTGNVASAQQAVGVLAEASKSCPEDPRLALWTGIAQIFGRDYAGLTAARARLVRIFADRAAELNRPASDAERDPHVLFLDAATYFYAGNRPDLALDTLVRLKARDGTFLPEQVSSLKFKSHMAQGSALVRQEKFDEAVKQTRLAVAEARGDVHRRDQALRNLGQIYRFADRWPEAQQVFEDLAKRWPKDVVILYALASIYADQLVYAKAVATWKTVLDLIDSGMGVNAADASSVADARLRYGMSLVQAQKQAEARVELLRYVEARPDDARGFYYLGNTAMMEWEEFDKAKEWLERSHRLDPWCASAILALGKLYTTFLPDEARRKEMERLMADEELVKARKKEMDRRKRERPDATDGCR